MFRAKNRLCNPWRFKYLCTLHKCTETLLGNHILFHIIRLSAVQNAKTCLKCPTRDVSNQCFPNELPKTNMKLQIDNEHSLVFRYMGIPSLIIWKWILDTCRLLARQWKKCPCSKNGPEICPTRDTWFFSIKDKTFLPSHIVIGIIDVSPRVFMCMLIGSFQQVNF